MTVLYDDRGLVLDRTESFLKEYKNIGIMTSGGTDSTFELYWLARCIDELNLHDSHTLLPIHGYDTTWSFDTRIYMNQIVEMIRGFFPKVTIFDPYIITFSNTSTVDFATPKSVYFKHTRDRLEKTGMVDVTITGSTSAPIGEDIDLGIMTVERDISIKKNQLNRGLLVTVDKKFLAHQYKKFNLMDNLFPLTKSCILTRSKTGKPCKQCIWCKEKMWAFGCYDGGVT